MGCKNVAIYPVSRAYAHKVTPSIKSLMVNTDVDKVILMTETDELNEYLPECVEVMNVSDNRYFSPYSLNATRSHHAYLCEMRVAFAEFLHYDRVLSLDADTLVLRDIGDEPWTLDLEGCHYGGSPEPLISDRRGRPYANAGVLLFDLNRIRMDKLAIVMVDALNNYSYQWLEQDCLFEHLRLKPLGSEWNACQFTDPVPDSQIKSKHFAYDCTWEYDDRFHFFDAMSWNVVEDQWRARHGKID